MSALRILAVAMALYVSVACGPGLSAPVPLLGKTQAPVRYGNAYFKIKVPAAPKATSASRKIRPLYLSPSTKSFAISTDGTSPILANVDPSTGYATVTLHHIPVGTHTFRVTAYDRLGGTGSILSLGSSGPVNVPAGYVSVYLTLSGVVASVALVLDYPNPTRGSPAIINLNVIAKDPDGNVILGAPNGSSAPYARPFTLTTSDALNGRLSTTTVQQSADGNDGLRVSVAYSGANVSKIVFSATGGGLAPNAVTAALLVPIAPPSVGEQLIAQQSADPIDAFSTLEAHQFLGTIGYHPNQGSYYVSLVADDASRLIYIGEEGSYGHERIDIFASSGAYELVDSIPTPKARFGGFAIDSAAGRLFSAQQGFGPDFTDIMVYSTKAGHALIGKIPFPNIGSPNLAIDAIAGRLYAAGCAAEFGCTPGFEVYSNTPPYKLLESHGKNDFFTAFCSIAVDPVSERLFLSECNLPNENPSYVDVYEAADLTHRAARIGPLTPGAQLAIDAKARVLYVTNQPNGFGVANYGYAVDAYGLDDGFLPLGSFPIRSAHFITVAPYAP